MNIAFVNTNNNRVLIVDIEEMTDVAHMTEQHAAFINLLCDKLNWHWEPVKQPRTNSRILSYKELKDAINDQV